MRIYKYRKDTTGNNHSHLRARFSSCDRIMFSHGNNQSTGETPIMRIDFATFQAAVATAMKAIMVQLNNTNGNGNSIDNPTRSKDQRHQQVSTYRTTPNHKSKNKNRKSCYKRGSSSTPGTTKRQQPVAAHTPTNPATSTPRTSYAEIRPKCGKCIFHHYGACRKLHC